MADSPLESGPVEGTSIEKGFNFAQGYQKLGNVVQEPVAPGVTGEMVEKAGMARAAAITALASGIDKGFSPLIDNMISGAQQQQAGADYAAGAQAGLSGSNASAQAAAHFFSCGITPSRVMFAPSYLIVGG